MTGTRLCQQEESDGGEEESDEGDWGEGDGGKGGEGGEEESDEGRTLPATHPPSILELSNMRAA